MEGWEEKLGLENILICTSLACMKPLKLVLRKITVFKQSIPFGIVIPQMYFQPLSPEMLSPL